MGCLFESSVWVNMTNLCTCTCTGGWQTFTYELLDEIRIVPYAIIPAFLQETWKIQNIDTKDRVTVA